MRSGSVSFALHLRSESFIFSDSLNNVKCGRPNVSDEKKSWKQGTFGLLNFVITVILFYCARVESSKGGNFRGSIYGGKKISNVNFVEPFFSGGGWGGYFQNSTVFTFIIVICILTVRKNDLLITANPPTDNPMGSPRRWARKSINYTK